MLRWLARLVAFQRVDTTRFGPLRQPISALPDPLDWTGDRYIWSNIGTCRCTKFAVNRSVTYFFFTMIIWPRQRPAASEWQITWLSQIPATILGGRSHFGWAAASIYSPGQWNWMNEIGDCRLNLWSFVDTGRIGNRLAGNALRNGKRQRKIPRRNSAGWSFC